MPTKDQLITKIRTYKRQNCPSNIEKLRKDDLIALANAIDAREAVITKLNQPRAPGAIATLAKAKANVRAKERAKAGAPRRGRPKKATEAKQEQEAKQEEKKREVKQVERKMIIREEEEDEEDSLEFRRKKANLVNISNMVASLYDELKIKIKSFRGNENHIEAHKNNVAGLYNRIKGQIENIIGTKDVAKIDKELKKLKVGYSLSEIIAKKEKWDTQFM